jgi:cytoskeletal protein CcmA (bactofilin family)
MAIFRRENVSSSAAASGGSSEPSNSSQKQRRITHIAAGTHMRGEVSGPTELLVEGEVAGEIRVEEAVTVGADGVVNGPISAPVVRIGGRVVGNVHATDRVEISASGSLEGDIDAPRIVIAEGAFFKGWSNRKKERVQEGRRSREPRPADPETS